MKFLTTLRAQTLRLQPSLPPFLWRLMKQVSSNVQGLTLFVLTLAGLIPSHGVRRMVYRLFGVWLGRGAVIHWQARFFGPAGVRIGDYSNIGNNAFLDGRRGLTIGNCVATGAEVMIYTLQHDVDSPTFEGQGGPVVIQDYAYIGPRVIILPGVVIGRGAVVGAGAVVTKDVAPYTVVGGVPARFIRNRNRELSYRPNFAMPFQ